jgi:hypothetical protein
MQSIRACKINLQGALEYVVHSDFWASPVEIRVFASPTGLHVDILRVSL